MSARIIKCKAEDLVGLLDEGQAEIVRRVGDILEVVSKKAVTPVRRGVPVAFGDLRDSVHASFDTVPKTVVDAPHAGAVEIGSLPHMPNIEALTKWVKLRGLQGLQGKRAIRKMAGPTTAGQAMKVAKHLKQHEVRGTRAKGRHTPVDAAELVAWAIAQTVQKEGTKPHWFVRNALPEIEAILRAQMKAHLKK